uniref:BTB domain-containing protein n=1 Tax=Arcella intermedia TaxID=1963864 RepID=A0A6B2LFQ6_9EUKA
MDVGGKCFSTHRTTLLKSSGFFKSKFGGSFVLKPEEDGTYFIDRDGFTFRHVLNFLRTGRVPFHLSDEERESLREDADYYALPELFEGLCGGLMGPIVALERREEVRGTEVVLFGGNEGKVIASRGFPEPVREKDRNREWNSGTKGFGCLVIEFDHLAVVDVLSIDLRSCEVFGVDIECGGTWRPLIPANPNHRSSPKDQGNLFHFSKLNSPPTRRIKVWVERGYYSSIWWIEALGFWY